jgi:outer membrane protein OmpA-like peptidoglycan-associated protein
VDDIRFAFDSSFIGSDSTDAKNDIRAELQLLSDLVQEHPESPLSIFAHADPVGNDDYNKQLSGRRATVFYALLISNSDPDTAVRLWHEVAQQEHWGANQQQAMQTFTGLPEGTADDALMQAYMQKLFPAELKLTKQDFLGEGADPKGKADYQGCSEFNPVLIFSTERNQDLEGQTDKTARNDANAPNRRVMVLLFRKGSKVDTAKWPCPRATEGVSGCIRRFWSDAPRRRTTRLPDKDRKFEETQDTFACRFYQRLVTTSPCELPLTVVKIRLFDAQARPLPFAPCLITEPGQKPRPARATGAPPSPLGTTPGAPPGSTSGGNPEDAVITLRVQKVPTTVNVKWSRPKTLEGPGAPLPKVNDPDDFEFELDVAIDISDADANQAARTRLKNLGYDVNPPIPVPGLGNPVQAFQRDYKPQFSDIVVDGTLNAPTTNAAKSSHDAGDPVLRRGSDIALKR